MKPYHVSEHFNLANLSIDDPTCANLKNIFPEDKRIYLESVDVLMISKVLFECVDVTEFSLIENHIKNGLMSLGYFEFTGRATIMSFEEVTGKHYVFYIVDARREYKGEGMLHRVLSITENRPVDFSKIWQPKGETM